MPKETFFTSDLHGFHPNIMLYCARTRFMIDNDLDKYHEIYVKQGKRFRVSDESVQKMNQGIVDEINAIVSEDDDLICCGDWVFGNKERYFQNAQWMRDHINANNVDLIIGNHDIPGEIHRLFRSCQHYAEWRISGHSFVISHYPMVTWNRSHHGSIHLFGHVHSLYNKKDHPHPVARPDLWCAFDVGVDTNDFKPYSVSDILKKAEPVWKAQKEAKKVNSEHHLF